MKLVLLICFTLLAQATWAGYTRVQGIATEINFDYGGPQGDASTDFDWEKLKKSADQDAKSKCRLSEEFYRISEYQESVDRVDRGYTHGYRGSVSANYICGGEIQQCPHDHPASCGGE